MKAGNAHLWRTSVVLVLVVPLLASCQQSEIDKLNSQVSQLESENERLRTSEENEHNAVTRLTEDLDQTTRNLQRLGKCLTYTGIVAASLARTVRVLQNPGIVLLGGADFNPGGACAYPTDPQIMRYMKRQLSLTNEYLLEISRERFEALCAPGGSDPTDPRCFP